MSQPGPRTKPTILKLLQGNPGHRALPKNEPKPAIPSKPMRPPAHMTEGARKEWSRVASSLHAMGMLTVLDRAALEAYCVLYDRWLRAEEKVEERGEVLKTAAGNIIQNPYLSVANRAREDMRKFLVEFGMTPSSRPSIQVPAQAAGDFDDI